MATILRAAEYDHLAFPSIGDRQMQVHALDDLATPLATVRLPCG
jgi:hypothetical protein